MKPRPPPNLTQKTSAGTVLAGAGIALELRQRAAVDGLDGGPSAHAVELGIDAPHLFDAPAHQSRRSHESDRQGNYGRHEVLRYSFAHKLRQLRQPLLQMAL